MSSSNSVVVLNLECPFENMMKAKGLTQENTYTHKILHIILRPPNPLRPIQGIAGEAGGGAYCHFILSLECRSKLEATTKNLILLKSCC